MTEVLIVDDEAMDREILRESVSSLGYRAEEARDGVEALERFRSRRHDVVITDLVMPRMDGIQLTDQLHEMDPLLPVLLVSGKAVHDLEAVAGRRGIAGYLPKPFPLRSLQDSLERAVEHRGLAVPEAAITVRERGDLVPYLVALSALILLLLLWLYGDHLLDLRALSHYVDTLQPAQP
jgi:CheY-like chemotaxis protein